MLFIDSTSSLEEHNVRFFLLCTHSVAGALPLGMITTSDERESTLKSALEMWCNILPPGAFFGKERDGPALVMTGNC